MRNLADRPVEAVGTATALLGVSVPPLFCPSPPGEIHPLRDLDILSIPNFFDHAGNCGNGLGIAATVITGGLYLEHQLDTEKTHPMTMAAVGAVAAVGVNAAYEAGVPLVLAPEKPENSPFDLEDTLFGGAGGLLYSIAFCASLLRQRARRKKLQ